MVSPKRNRSRKKKSGLVYFAVNIRLQNMVKIGMTIDSVERRIEMANRKNEFMPGRWSVTQRVKTNDTKRTENLAQTIFEDYLDSESVSTEMYFVPENLTVKQMADLVRDKDRIYIEQMEDEEKAREAVQTAQKILETLHKKHKEELSYEISTVKKE